MGMPVGVKAAISPAFDESPIARSSDIVAVFDNHLPPRQDGFGEAFYFKPFVSAVVDVHMMGPAVEIADSLLMIGIENDDVGVAADRKRTLPREQTKNLSRCGRGELDEAGQRNMPMADAIVIDQAHPVLDTWSAIGNLAEIVASEFLLLLEAKRTVVGGDDVEGMGAQPAPELVVVPVLTERRSEHIFGAVETGSRLEVPVQQQILGEGLRVSHHATGLREA